MVSSNATMIVTPQTCNRPVTSALSTPLRKGDWTDTVAPGTELEVRVKSPETRHTVTVAQP